MEIIHQLRADRAREIYRHISQHLIPQMTPEKTTAALGRKQLWLEAEPDYGTGSYRPATTDPRLWAYIKKIWPQADLAQIYGGNRGIEWHRDAAYAAPDARIINLGPCTLQSDHGEIVSLDLKGGEIIRFNSKLPHRCINPHPKRIGIGIWQAKIPINFQQELI